MRISSQHIYRGRAAGEYKCVLVALILHNPSIAQVCGVFFDVPKLREWIIEFKIKSIQKYTGIIKRYKAIIPMKYLQFLFY